MQLGKLLLPVDKIGHIARQLSGYPQAYILLFIFADQEVIVLDIVLAILESLHTSAWVRIVQSIMDVSAIGQFMFLLLPVWTWLLLEPTCCRCYLAVQHIGGMWNVILSMTSPT